jgi:hypothetical protein
MLMRKSTFKCLRIGILCCVGGQLLAQARQNQSVLLFDGIANITHGDQCVSMFAVLDPYDTSQSLKHQIWQNHGLVHVRIVLSACGNLGPMEIGVLPAFAEDLHFAFARALESQTSDVLPLKSRIIEYDEPVWRENHSTKTLVFSIYGGPDDEQEWKLLITVSSNGETLKQVRLTVPKELSTVS